jgi:Cof subfamily protein (haloacid dehalogenase superfamily)
MVYKLLAVNIDGTLVQSNGRLNKVTKEAITYVYDKGVHVALVTSKNYLYAKKIAKALKINPRLVALQGAFVGTSIEKPLFVKQLSEVLSLEIVKVIDKLDCQIQLHHEDHLVGNRVNLPENIVGKTVLYDNDSSVYAHHYADDLCEYLKENPGTPSKIDLIFNSEKEMRDAKEVLRKLFPEVKAIKCSESKLSVVAQGVSKWKGLLYLADHLDVKKSEIVSIGDSFDDLDMILGSGLGVAMANAHPEVKKCADWITRTNDENGVAYMLKEFFRKQHPIEFLSKMNLLK